MKQDAAPDVSYYAESPGVTVTLASPTPLSLEDPVPLWQTLGLTDKRILSPRILTECSLYKTLDSILRLP